MYLSFIIYYYTTMRYNRAAAVRRAGQARNQRSATKGANDEAYFRLLTASTQVRLIHVVVSLFQFIFEHYLFFGLDCRASRKVIIPRSVSFLTRINAPSSSYS